MTPQQTGSLLLCVICIIPPGLGFALAWWWRGRADQYGILGALLPEWARTMLGF